MTLKTSKWLYAVLLIYSILLFLLILKHEPWFDEAQAWLIAKDSNVFVLFTKLLRYEGSPGLWHLILMPFAKLGLPYISLNIISGTIAIISTYLFLKYSPFPFYIKLLYPFSYFAFYQYAVIARSYVLFPLVLFLIAMSYENKVLHPYRYLLLLILLSNISLHGLIIAVGLQLLNFLGYVKNYAAMQKETIKNLVISYSIFGIFIILTVLELKPAPDLISVASLHGSFNKFLEKTNYILSEALTTNFSAHIYGNDLSYSISHSFYWLILISTGAWFIIRKKLAVFMIPLLGLGALFTAVYANVWHQGVLFYLWLFSLWISFKENPNYSLDEYKPLLNIKPAYHFIRPAVLFCMIWVLVMQIYWSFNTFLYDFNNNYSASKEAAEYIKTNELYKKKIYMTSFHTASILPYFSCNIFCNFNKGKEPCYWLWSGKNNIYQEPYLNISSYQPDYILMGVKDYCDKYVPLDSSFIPEVPGYRPIKYFTGCLYWKERTLESDSFALYEKIQN